MKNMSFSLTTEQVRNSFQLAVMGIAPIPGPDTPTLAGKDVTRRLDWLTLKVGDRLVACVKCMGRKKGEPLQRICTIEVVSVCREPLRRMLDEPAYGRQEVRREGFPNMTPAAFVQFFCESHKGCTPDTVITRIEFKYILRCMFGIAGDHLAAGWPKTPWCEQEAKWATSKDGLPWAPVWCDSHKLHTDSPCIPVKTINQFKT